MLSGLASMPAAFIFGPCNEKWIAVCLLPPIYERHITQSPDIQPGPAWYPFYTTGIADKNLKLVELEILVSFWPEARSVEFGFLTSTVLPPYPMTEPAGNTGEALPISINRNGTLRKERSLVHRTYGCYLRSTPVRYRSDCHLCPFRPVGLSEESWYAPQQGPRT